jgi:hypothetical protein
MSLQLLVMIDLQSSSRSLVPSLVPQEEVSAYNFQNFDVVLGEKKPIYNKVRRKSTIILV